MKTLVYFTNYEGNDKVDHLNKILSELNNIDFLIIDIVIYTTEELKLNTFNNLNVLTEIHPKVFSDSPYKSEWQPEPEFIWLYRKDLITSVNDYELVIHLEDDIYLSTKNIKTFLEHNDSVGDNYIIGNIVYEEVDGVTILPQFHKQFKGVKGTININGKNYITTKNDHQASWIATQKQLKYLIDNGHMKPTPKLVGGYNIKCSSVTEIYSTKLLTKIIPVDDIEGCLIEHITKKYINLYNNKSSFWYKEFQTLDEIITEIKNKK